MPQLILNIGRWWGNDPVRKEQAEIQRKINALIDSLADFSDSTAAVHLKKRIEELNAQDATLSSRIRELESLTDSGVLGGIEFDVMRQLLTVFHDNIDDMTVTQKRAAIRTVVRKVVWDGKVAHVVLFGSPEDEIDWTTFPVDPGRRAGRSISLPHGPPAAGCGE